MKELFITLILLTLVSCKERIDVNSTKTSVQLGHTVPLKVIKIDGCQYLYGDWGTATTLTHKGNCNNPIHTLKSE
jgi:hypothetical protein